MLESDYQQSLTRMLAQHPCGVQLPTGWEEFFARDGHLPSLAGDQRRFARRHSPGRAIMELAQTLPAVQRGRQTCTIVTKNVSRAAIAFLHTSQLYPGERLLLWLPGGKAPTEVARCKRHNARCYEIVAMFDQLQPARR